MTDTPEGVDKNIQLIAHLEAVTINSGDPLYNGLLKSTLSEIKDRGGFYSGNVQKPTYYSYENMLVRLRDFAEGRVGLGYIPRGRRGGVEMRADVERAVAANYSHVISQNEVLLTGREFNQKDLGSVRRPGGVERGEWFGNPMSRHKVEVFYNNTDSRIALSRDDFEDQEHVKKLTLIRFDFTAKNQPDNPGGHIDEVVFHADNTEVEVSGLTRIQLAVKYAVETSNRTLDRQMKRRESQSAMATLMDSEGQEFALAKRLIS